MLALLCADPTRPGRVDPDWERESAAARRAGFEVSLLDHDALVRGEVAHALERVGSAPGSVVYRGWMMSAGSYAQLYHALRSKGLEPLTSPEAYRRCHHLPEAYSSLASITPRTVWVDLERGLSMDRIRRAIEVFGSGPILVKDYVKSRKHEWREACFIPDASDEAAVDRVVRRFLELTGEDLTGGLVFREFVDLEQAGRHPESGMPLAREHRFFVLDGRAVVSTPYWGGAEDPGSAPDPTPFLATARALGSRFFTLDVAKRKDGPWIVIEPGDGQVAGLPESVDPKQLWRGLAKALSDPGSHDAPVGG